MTVNPHRKTKLANKHDGLLYPVIEQNHRAVAAIVGLTALLLPTAVPPQQFKSVFFNVYQLSDSNVSRTWRTRGYHWTYFSPDEMTAATITCKITHKQDKT